MITEATELEREAIDLYQFTSQLNRELDEKGRARMVEMMWQVAYADGVVSEFEDNLIWRGAGPARHFAARAHRAAKPGGRKPPAGQLAHDPEKHVLDPDRGWEPVFG